MTPARRRWVCLVAALLWASGAGWLVAHHWLVRPGDYGPVPSPVEPWALRLHGGCGYAAVALLGLLWGVHIGPRWRMRRARLSGALLVSVTLVLTGSGWLLYYVADDDWRAGIAQLHWLLGLAGLPVFLAHRLTARGRARRGRAAPNL